MDIVTKHIVTIAQLPRIQVKLIPSSIPGSGNTSTPAISPPGSGITTYQYQYISNILKQFPPEVFDGYSPKLYLYVLLSMEISLHTIEVMNRLASSITLPYLFYHIYIINNIQSCNNIKDKSIQVCSVFIEIIDGKIYYLCII